MRCGPKLKFNEKSKARPWVIPFDKLLEGMLIDFVVEMRGERQAIAQKNGTSPAGIQYVEFLTERSVRSRLVRPALAHPRGVTSEFSRRRMLFPCDEEAGPCFTRYPRAET